MDLEKLLTEISELMHRSMDHYTRESFRESRVGTITVNQLFYLEAIYNLDSPTLSELAEHLQVAGASASVAVKKLIKRGLVQKKPSDKDRRVIHLHLTTDGDIIVSAKHRAFAGFFARIRKSLTDDEIRGLSRIVKKIINANT